MFKQKILTPVAEYAHKFMVFGLTQMPTQENYSEFMDRSGIIIPLKAFKENDIKFMLAPTSIHFCHDYGQCALIESSIHEVASLAEVKKFAYVYSIDFNQRDDDNIIIIRGVTKEHINGLNEEMKRRYDNSPLIEFPIMA